MKPPKNTGVGESAKWRTRLHLVSLSPYHEPSKTLRGPLSPSVFSHASASSVPRRRTWRRDGGCAAPRTAGRPRLGPGPRRRGRRLERDDAPFALRSPTPTRVRKAEHSPKDSLWLPQPKRFARVGRREAAGDDGSTPGRDPARFSSEWRTANRTRIESNLDTEIETRTKNPSAALEENCCARRRRCTRVETVLR